MRQCGIGIQSRAIRYLSLPHQVVQIDLDHVIRKATSCKHGSDSGWIVDGPTVVTNCPTWDRTLQDYRSVLGREWSIGVTFFAPYDLAGFLPPCGVGGPIGTRTILVRG